VLDDTVRDVRVGSKDIWRAVLDGIAEIGYRVADTMFKSMDTVSASGNAVFYMNAVPFNSKPRRY
jgi:hypothetical protein